MKFTTRHEVSKPLAKPTQDPRCAVVAVTSLGEGDPILCSRPTGERYRPRVDQSAGIARFVILDFSGAEVVTPSFFLGGPWSLWEREELEQYPLVANLPTRALDDLEIVTSVKRTPIWTGHFEGGRFRDPQLIGDLEDADKEILFHALERGSVSAAELVKSIGRLGVTGWNNRLAGLWQRKVLMRTKKGRMFVYSPPWKGLGHG